MRSLRGVCAVALLFSSLYQSGILTCGRSRADHPVCPMHGARSGMGGAHLESASSGACHDPGSGSHCVPGLSCAASLAAFVPGPMKVGNDYQVRRTRWAPAQRWLSHDAGRTGPPPKLSIRMA